MNIDDICVKIELPYEYIEAQPVRRLKQVAERLNIAPSGLANLIMHHGGKFEKNSNPILEEEHIKIVAVEYIKSVQHLFYQAKRAHEEGVSYGASQEFFYQFVDYKSLIHAIDFTSWHLSEELIGEAFYKLINSPVRRTDNGSWALNRIMHRMLRIVFSYCLDLKLLIKSILSPQLFFTYASEEDLNKVAISTGGFFVA